MALAAFTVTFLNDDVNHAAFLYLDGDNSGTLRFTPSVQATLKPGTLTPWQDDDSFRPSGSVLYLFGLNRILSDEQIEGMKFDEGWESAHYHDTANGIYWAFTPKKEMTVHKGDHADLPIAHVKVGRANNVQATTLYVTYYNVDGLTHKGGLNHKNAYFPVALCPRPGSKPLPSLSDKLDFRFVDGHEREVDGVPNAEWIRTSPWKGDPTINACTLQIQPKAGESGIQAGADTTLILSFVSGEDAFGAFASREDISHIDLRAESSAGKSWGVTRVMDGPHPYWEVSVPEGCELSGRLYFENVISHLDPGWTTFTLQYTHVPDYRDGQVELPVYKYGPPIMEHCSASIVATYLNTRYGPLLSGAKLTVQWACYSIEKMKIELINTSTSYRLLTDDGGESGSIEYDVLDAAERELEFGFGVIYFSIVPLAYPFPDSAERDTDWSPGYPFWITGIGWKSVIEEPTDDDGDGDDDDDDQ